MRAGLDPVAMVTHEIFAQELAETPGASDRFGRRTDVVAQQPVGLIYADPQRDSAEPV